MRKERLVLHFETVNGQFPETAVAAQALIDWVTLVHVALWEFSPHERLSIEIVGVHEGSSRFPQLLKWLDEQTGTVKQGLDAYPHLKSIVVGSAHTLFTSTVAASVALMMQPDEQVVRLNQDDRSLLQSWTAQVAASSKARRASQRFYRTLEADTSISGIGVASGWQARPPIIIPRREFPERGGLWELDEDAPATRPQRDIWDVVLRRPALISKPQAWEFSRDGFKFSAQMADARFLLALREGRVPLTLQEGVVMRVEVEWLEALDGQIWELVPRSRRIVRVLTPSPIPESAPEKP